MQNFFLSLITLFIFTTSHAFAQEKLIFAADLIRHGDRTPIHDIPTSPHVWKEGLGQLTTLGINQEKQLGAALRKKYVQQYHLLPEKYNPKTLYVHSTAIKRTEKSADAFLLGLYPQKMRAMITQKIPIHLEEKNDHVLIAKSKKNIFSLARIYLANRKSWGKNTKQLQTKLIDWHLQTGLSLNNFHQLEQLADNLYIRNLHHVALPKGITPADAEKIIALGELGIVNEFKQKEITYPMGKNFLQALSQYFQSVVQNKTALKYVLFSGHDSSIMSVMTTLGSPLPHLPAYASDLNFSLYQNTKEYYVKVSYNNQPVNIPDCGGSVCTLAQFAAITKHH